MEANALHDLTAAYALDALDSDDARAYEAHLARCERCREELAELSDAAGALAYGTEAPMPPPELRARILQEAARERPNVVPLRPRWVKPVAAIAAVAACTAIGARHLGRHALEQARSQRIPARAAGASGADRRPAGIPDDFLRPRNPCRGAERRGCPRAQKPGARWKRTDVRGLDRRRGGSRAGGPLRGRRCGGDPP